MKLLTPQLAYLITQQENRANLKALFKYFVVLLATIVVFSIGFHLLMLWEGQYHSWITGIYWTLTVMSTLGFGDITFHTDAGRLFSLLVLLTGIVLLLIVLPFAFIRFFYAPWLEAQIHTEAPRRAPKELADHVIICSPDEIGFALVDRLKERQIPYVLIEPNSSRAASLHRDGYVVVCGEVDRIETFAHCRAETARMVVANLSDPENSNVSITVRDRFPSLQIAAFAQELDSVDVLQLSGANHVIPVRHRLGESLAYRVAVGPAHAQIVGRFKDLVIAEFPIENSGLAGRTIRDTHLRELTGLNFVGCWKRGHMVPAKPDTLLEEHSVAIVVGTEEQIEELDALFVIYWENEAPVVVIGGGKVGKSVATALKRRGISLHLIEKDPSMRDRLTALADRVIIGDASDRRIIEEAGIGVAPSVVLTTNDDAMNIFLAVYCHRLNPATRIVSRINHERNLDSIYRAGANSVLSYTTLAVSSLLEFILGSPATFLGEGVDLIIEPVPSQLLGVRLADAKIAEKTGLNVIGVQRSDESVASASANTTLDTESRLVMLGEPGQHQTFIEVFK